MNVTGSRTKSTGIERRFAVIGGTFAGNKGAAGMLESLIVNLSRRAACPVRFDVISIYPSSDRSRPKPDNVKIIPARSIPLVIILPALAILYALLQKLRLPRKFLLAFAPLKAIVKAEALLDVSGISYVDGRGATLVYNVACNLPALAVGTPLVKMSQAIGPFRTFLNRAAARFILSRTARIFARGHETEENLRELALENVSAAADLAFILNEHMPIPQLDSFAFPDPGDGRPVIGVSPSQVLRYYCDRSGKDLVKILAQYLDKLQELTGAHIAIIAHSLLEPEKRSRNNDYHVCSDLFDHMRRKESATLVVDDLTPSELRAVIARCSFFVACRFHGMISALCVEVPTLVIAWSHKYHEVMNAFGLGDCVIEISDLNPDSLLEKSKQLLDESSRFRLSIRASLPSIKDSSRTQIDFAAGILEAVYGRIAAGQTARNLYDRFYSGKFTDAFIGYSTDPAIGPGSASGGLVSTLLINELENGRASAAICCRTIVEDGRLEFKSVTCSSRDEILDCRTSIYSDFNHARNVIGILREYEGPFAVVALPCQWKMIGTFLDKNPEYRERVALRIGLWCGHATDRRLIDDFLRIKGVDTREIQRFYYRKGLWRGESVAEMNDGTSARFAFRSGYGLLQNLYVDCKMRCYSCTDHFAEYSDVSFGDAWLRECRKMSVKHSMGIPITDRGTKTMHDLADSAGAYLVSVDPRIAVQSQKRAVIWHTYGSVGRSRTGRLFGLKVINRSTARPRWNDYVSSFLILAAFKMYGTSARGMLLRLPWPLPYCYMLVQKTFLNF